MNNIVENINNIKKNIPEYVKLIAVSKTKPVEDILSAYNGGCKVFGENKAQELQTKQPQLPNDIEWHFIGHLQTNKVKYIAPFVSLIHSVDSIKLMKEINKQAEKNNRIIDFLFEIHIAQEDSKFGLNAEGLAEILKSEEIKKLTNIRPCGVMGMATYTEDFDQIRKEFKQLKQVYDSIKQAFFMEKPYFKEISMGMTNDYTIAIQEGATMIRIGSAIFGLRACSISG